MEKKKICIIGCGTYGSYLLKRLLDKFDTQFDITVIEIGDKNIKTEYEIGFLSKSEKSHAAKSGRYFGLGGTSTRWGGQILFFDKRDNINNDPDWQKIVQINETYKDTVLANVFEKHAPAKIFKDDKSCVKVGIWLKYARRNLYKNIDSEKLKNVKILKNQRVINFDIARGSIQAVNCRDRQGTQQKVKADIFYLTSGAIESCRLLLQLNEQYALFNETDLGKNIGDHLSVEICKITNTQPILEGIDFTPLFHKGHLITKRLIIYAKDGRVGYIHPIFNKDVTVFSVIKNLLFGKQKMSFAFKSIFLESGFLFKMFFSVFFRHRLHIHKNDWRLQLDIEQTYPNDNTLSLDTELDAYQQKGIKINWQISNKDKAALLEMQVIAANILTKNGISFESTYDPNITTHKIEDVYHPVGFIRMGSDKKVVLDFNGKVKALSNLYHFSTAMFSSAKSINPTAAAFAFIEYHFEEK